MTLNEFQTSFEELFLDVNEDVKQEILDYVYGVPFIQNLISDKRKRASECERDESGKIKIDLENPHILEDMDYFREMAIHYEKHGCYTFLKPNPNPKSEYGKLIVREVERCYEGMVRPSDGEWITGDYYYFLNYCPMLLSSRRGKGNAANRIMSFPSVWEGHYLKFHYINMARNAGMHGAELASRSKGKSFTAAALLAKRFNLGESKDVREKVVSYITASDKKYLVGGDQTLDKFVYDIDFFANNMGLPYLRLVDSLMNMQWVMGYKDMDTNTRKGTQNSVIGVSSKDDPSKLRGTRGVLYILEEWGSFPKLLDLYNNLRPSVEEGMGEERMTFGMIFAQGTSGDNANDFGSAQTIMYSPEGYNMYPIDNVYDKKGEGAKKFIFFFPAYLNLAGCYNENGVSDVTKAIKQIIIDRNKIKKNTNDINSITKRIAELPITPQEAVLRTKGNIFPTTDLMQRIIQLDNNPHAYDENYTGWLEFNGAGEVEFVLSGQQPIRIYPLDDNKNEGVIEIYQMPEKDRNGKVFQNRYCIGHDPVDDDVANDSLSLTSTFVFDLWTDKIVAEWTGRKMFADECYEVVRRLCIFYNARCLYENNKKGMFSYFSRMNCLHYLADTPEYLRDKQLIKDTGYGNKSKGVAATLPINNFANERIRDWLLKPVPIKKDEEEMNMPTLYTIKSRALLEELRSFNPVGNFDRVRALGMVMLYRESQIILYNGDVSKAGNEDTKDLSKDDFFNRNYHKQITNKFLNERRQESKVFKNFFENYVHP